MTNMDDYKISIKNLSHSSKHDKSKYYLIDIKIIINEKKIEHTDYLDPFTNEIASDVVPFCTQCEGNDRTKILSEFLIRFGLSHDQSIQLFSKVVDNLNYVIRHNESVKKLFPPLLDLIDEAQGWGFDCRKIAPFYHFIKTERDGAEQHIHTTSIRDVVNEIYNYRHDGNTSEVYPFVMSTRGGRIISSILLVIDSGLLGFRWKLARNCCITPMATSRHIIRQREWRNCWKRLKRLLT